MIFNKEYLKGQQGHNDSHPADGHGDVGATLLCDHVHRAQEKHGPDDVIKHHKTQEGHENPQRHTHHLDKNK